MYLKRLRELREDNDYTQLYIARILKTTQQQYQRYESGKRDLPLEYLVKLCALYKVTSDYILEIDKRPPHAD